MATALIRLPQVRRLTGLSRSEIYRRMGLGEFPAKVNIGSRAIWLSPKTKYLSGLKAVSDAAVGQLRER